MANKIWSGHNPTKTKDELTDDFLNELTKNPATQFKVGCSYLGFVSSTIYEDLLIAFTIEKINKKSITYSKIYNPKNKPPIKRQYDNNKILSPILKTRHKKQMKEGITHNTFILVGQHNHTAICPFMCYEINDIEVMTELIKILALLRRGDIEDRHFKNKTIKYLYESEKYIDIIDF